MQSIDSIKLLPVWVNPGHLASTAKIILAGHRLRVLGVVDGAALVGVLTADKLASAGDTTTVEEIMREAARSVDSETDLRNVAETFYKEDLDYVAVVHDGRFRGMLTPNMLLKEMARSWDPLTGLSWSDSLREWGVDNLKNGKEITLLFIDLDDFGSYNKKYGHIVGDRVLQAVAQMIEDTIDPKRDLLVRYAGDEFAIGSLRDQAEAIALGGLLRHRMSTIRVEGSEEQVTFCVGVQGGKRSAERENVHYAATLDNLINLASRDCLAQKQRKSGAPEVTAVVTPAEPATPASPTTSEEAAPAKEESPAEEPRGEAPTETQADMAEAAPAETPVATAEPETKVETAVIEMPVRGEITAPPATWRIAEVTADAADANSTTEVQISAGDQMVTGSYPRKGGSVVKSVALATASAIAQVRPDAQMDIQEVNLTESETGVRFISVIGRSVINGDEQPIGGVGTVGRNLYLTVAEATLQAFTNLEAVREGTKD